MALQGITPPDLETLLQRQLFACTRKSLQDHLEQLVTLKWLQHSPQHTGRSKHYLRVKQFPTQNQPDQHSFSDCLTASELANLAQAVNMLSFLDPRLAPISNQLAEQVLEQVNNCERCQQNEHTCPVPARKPIQRWQVKEIFWLKPNQNAR